MSQQEARRRQALISKTLSLWLRHDPAAGGLTLDAQGWTEVESVLAALGGAVQPAVSLDELDAIVAGSDKQRFSLEAGRIRANQGQSVALDLDFRPVEPPAALYHGTTRERRLLIQASGGLAKLRRHHVHLSHDVATARRLAQRHQGEAPLVLQVAAERLRAADQPFFISENGVYLTDAVPLAYLREVAPDR